MVKERKRVLVIYSYPLSPNQDGGSLQMFITLDLLRAFSFHIAFAALDLASSPAQRDTLDTLEIQELNETNTRSLDAHLQEYGNMYDLVWLTGVSSAIYHLGSIRHYAPRAKLVFDTTDLQHVRLYRRAKLEQHAGWLQIALKTKQWELATTNAADCTLVVSAEEQRILQQACPTARIHLHSLVHPVQNDVPLFAERQGILFVGSFPHHPNQDAMQFYFGEIHPRVQAQLDVPLYIVGPQPPDWLVAHATETIIVTGHVPDLAPYLCRARVSIAPLRYGAGVKGKVIESMSYGVPVVATSVAAEGIPVQHEQDVLIADTPVAFADAVAQLYQNKTTWNRIARNGLDLAQKHYSRGAAQKRLAHILNELELL